MKTIGLVTANFYMVYRSMWLHVVGMIVLFYTYLFTIKGLAIPFFSIDFQFIVPIFIIYINLVTLFPAFEVLKVEEKSGYNKYGLTLPIRRKNIVKSHYLFLFFAAIISTLATFGVFVVPRLLSWVSMQASDFELFLSMFSVFIISGSIFFPCSYIFGTERSKLFLFITFIISYICGSVVGQLLRFVVEDLMNLDIGDSSVYTVAVMIYLLIATLFYMLSYVISQAIYRKKEF
ncbi:ABC-2 transporter permease [Lysinibacillus sphaericus]|uniref:ABC-2 transporter permease n=1 Tax=Lysinibacillus sphaericus TaxID=1421 RepID=UPI003D7FCA79